MTTAITDHEGSVAEEEATGITRSRPVRLLHGTEVPAPGVWKVDPGHAEVGFWGRHFMITKVRGRFTGVDATVEIAERPEDSMVEAVIDMASVDSGDRSRDDHLRSGDFFDVDNWPTGSFRSTAVVWSGARGTIGGELTIRGVTRPLTLDVAFEGALRDPWDQERAVFSATALIDREDWGLTWNMPLAGGGLLVSKEITLEINVEMVRDG